MSTNSCPRPSNNWDRPVLRVPPSWAPCCRSPLNRSMTGIPRRRGNSRRRPRPPSEVLSAAWCRRAAVLRVRPPSRCAAAAVSATCASTGAMCGGLRDAGRLMGSARARTAPGCPKSWPSGLAGGRAALPAPRLSSSTTGRAPSRVAIISLLRAAESAVRLPARRYLRVHLVLYSLPSKP